MKHIKAVPAATIAVVFLMAGNRSQAANESRDPTAVRPFTVPIQSQAALDDLRRRVAATRWPEKETVNDRSQGVQLATMQASDMQSCFPCHQAVKSRDFIFTRYTP